MNALDRFRDYLASVKPGKLLEHQISEIAFRLADCWDHLQVPHEGGMTRDKLAGRTEDMEWRSPTLSFKIERHGAMVRGSSRAEIQSWEINPNLGTATLVATACRQVRQMDRRLDVKPIAADIATIVKEGREDERIKWRGTADVRILTGDIIPATNRLTTASRRTRFAAELERLLSPQGWRRKKAGSHLKFERRCSG